MTDKEDEFVGGGYVVLGPDGAQLTPVVYDKATAEEAADRIRMRYGHSTAASVASARPADVMNSCTTLDPIREQHRDKWKAITQEIRQTDDKGKQAALFAELKKLEEQEICHVMQQYVDAGWTREELVEELDVRGHMTTDDETEEDLRRMLALSDTGLEPAYVICEDD